MLSDILIRIRALFRRDSVESELDDELRFHFEQQVEKFVESGVPLAEARRRTRLIFGGTDQIKEECREARGVRFLETLWQDLRYAVRMLRKSPGFAAVAVLTLALGIGANTAIFSLINAAALRSLPVSNPQQLVLLHWAARDKPNANYFVRSGGCPADAEQSSSSVTGCSLSYPMFEQIRSARDVFSGVFAFVRTATALKINGRPGQFWGMYVSGEFFPTLGARPAIGRMLDAQDDVPGAASVVVLSYRYWQSETGADPTVLAKTALINRRPFTIVGIADRSFPELDPGVPVDFWLPLASQATVTSLAPSRTDPNSLWLDVLARLNPGVTTRRAEARLNTIFVPGTTSGPTPLFKASGAPRITLSSAAEGLATLRTMYSKPLFVLMTAVCLILLLACANVAGLTLARSCAREKEMTVRRALGAGRWRIVRQVLTESVLLSAAGGALGILVAELGAESLISFLSANSYLPLQIDAGIDRHVLAFTLVVSAAVGILFGLAPALRGSRLDVAPSARATGNRRGPAPKHSSHLSNALVVAQVAISILVLVGAGLLGRTLVNLETTDAGFQTKDLLLFQVDMKASGMSIDDPRFNRLNQELQDRFAALPGVSSASYSSLPLLSGGSFTGEWNIPDAPSSSAISSDLLNVGPRFFETMEIPILTGRTFTRSDFDLTTEPKPVVVNESLARKLFGEENPLGRVINEGHTQKTQWQIVGVVADTKYESLRKEAAPTVFKLDKYGSPTFELRTQGNPKALISMVGEAVGQTNSDFVILRVMTQSEQIDRTIYQERLVASLSALFGFLALTLACIGLYGLVAYGVVRRTHEIGVRMALGAERRNILSLVVGHGLRLTLIGIAAGITGAMALTRFLSSLLYGVKWWDPATFVGVSLLLAGVALLACFIPARRAAKVDPMDALRYE
jgi:predicted permease